MTEQTKYHVYIKKIYTENDDIACPCETSDAYPMKKNIKINIILLDFNDP
jgi:hypothetical protein